MNLATPTRGGGAGAVAGPPPELDLFTGTWTPGVPVEPAALRAWQLERAWDVVARTAAGNPFYRRRLRLSPDRTEAAFRQLPVTRKHEVVADCAAHPPFGSRTTVPASDIRMIVQTSGTSGRGTEVYALSVADEAAITYVEAIGFAWAGIGAGTVVLLTLPIGLSAAGQWYYAALRMLGATVLPVGVYPTDRKVGALFSYRAEAIVSTPSYLERLAVACEDAGGDPRALGVRTLMVAGQPYSVDWGRSIERRWGATLYEQYGCTERAIAWTCPGGALRTGERGVLHFPAEAGYCEVIDPESGEPVGDRAEGELVVTPFGADASPLVRYATGDRVRYVAAGSCECRRPLPGIVAGAVVRYDDMMKIRGVNVWPAALDDAVFAVAGVTDYRGRVYIDENGSEVIVVRLEADRPGVDASTEVAAAIQSMTGLAARVVVESPGTVAREVPEGFVKITRWTDDRSLT